MPFRKPVSPLFCSRNAILAATLLLGGCFIPSSNTFTRNFTISGGGTVTLSFTPGGLIPDENADVKLLPVSIDLKKEFKAIDYHFSFTEKEGRGLRSVVVEDVSDPKAEILVEDGQPSLQGKDWHGVSGPKLPDDPRLAWLNDPDDTFRIFRYTIVTADGRQIVMYNAAGYLPFAKTYLKKQLGLDKSSS